MRFYLYTGTRIAKGKYYDKNAINQLFLKNKIITNKNVLINEKSHILINV